jgi:hypothetical protein
MNLCPVCGEDFGGVQAYDAHRRGSHDYCWSPERPDGRRCLTPSELQERGFWRNSRGRWSLPGSASLSKEYRKPKVTETKTQGSV